MDLKALLEQRSQREQYMIFMGLFLVVFYLFYLSWSYFDRIYSKALMRYETQLNSYLNSNSPEQIQNHLDIVIKKLQDKKQELDNLTKEYNFINTHTKLLASYLSKFNSSSEILGFIDSKAQNHNLKIDHILPNSIKSNSNIAYDYNISFSSDFISALGFIDELRGAMFDISEAKLEPYSSQIRIILWDFK
ncbi:hypothetical protein CVIC8964_0221 [Campylobacter vicugnae]|uniref:Uncharacterized protein n=1 Tax=Campylobacter vicugnae TaxID=1660076 RepID=A0A1X9SZF3_9BACT|nr:hypothetical protein [Campylobacter sp. RM8964]ARR01658.1 hypothetical protein CVIC8964_0221 [Campylobacter sp. RM8964]